MNNKDKKSPKEVKFERKYERIVYNPIRPFHYPNHTHNFVSGDSSVTSNAIGRDNPDILATFCYDYHYGMPKTRNKERILSLNKKNR